jgi:hypothetical protein
MSGLIELAIGLALLFLLLYRAAPIWLDGGQRGMELARRLTCTLVGIVAPHRYWWGARLEGMSPGEQADLLTRETAALGLARADSLRCPLCGADVPRAWALDFDGRPTAAPGQIKCPRCDFRLRACRHCAHFLSGNPPGWGRGGWSSDDWTFGRCSVYKELQPVEQVSSPEMARQLKSRGFDQVRAPLPIVDSYIPPDSCMAFKLDRRRLLASGIRWPDARRVALLRMIRVPAVSRAGPAEEPAHDEQWLL